MKHYPTMQFKVKFSWGETVWPCHSCGAFPTFCSEPLPIDTVLEAPHFEHVDSTRSAPSRAAITLKNPPCGGLRFAISCPSLSDFTAVLLCWKNSVVLVIPMVVQEHRVKENRGLVIECDDQSTAHLIYCDNSLAHHSLWQKRLAASVRFRTYRT
jgi:hypothetical protein